MSNLIKNTCDQFQQLIQDKINLFNQNQKTILFIEPYGAVLSLVKHGLAAGFNIIILTANMDLRIVPNFILNAVSLAIEVDTAIEVDITKIIDHLKPVVSINAVIPGFEYFVPLAAVISSQLNCPGIDVKNVMKLRRKDLMREALKLEGIDTPKFYCLSSIDDLQKAINTVGFPAVCKPIDAAGSVNVRKVNTRSESLLAAWRILNGKDVLWGHTLSNNVLFEEYIEGPEYSVEGIVQEKVPTYFSITEKFVSDEKEFVEVGHIVNVPVKPSLKNQIEGYINSVIAVLGADQCPFHAEIRINSKGKPVLMEIAARMPGDKIADLITLSGVNFFECIYDTYLGRRSALPLMSNIPVGIRFFYRPMVDSYKWIAGLDQVHQHADEVMMYYEPHTPIPAFPKPLRRLGHAIIKLSDYSLLKQKILEVDQLVSFQ